jgi:tetratricopeptide (TPR) repeat protein
MYRNIPELIQAGVFSFKIEGRMRPADFIRRIVSTYRKAIDAYIADPFGYQVDEDGWQDLYKNRARDFTTTFALGQPDASDIGFDGSREPRFFSDAVEEAGFQAGLYKMEAGNFQEAIADFEAYKDNETYGAGAMYNIGICRMNLGEFAAAVEAFVSCEEKGGTFEGLYYNRGVCRLLTGKWADAATDFAKSIETEPYRDDATYNLGICQMQQEDYETAEATFTQYIAENDKTPENGEPAEAGSETERIVNYGAYYYRAACRAALGKLEDAVADYTVCIEQQYELAQSYYQRAQVYAALGDTGKQNADLAESLKYAE